MFYNCYAVNMGAAVQQCVCFRKLAAITVVLFECGVLGHLATTT